MFKETSEFNRMIELQQKTLGAWGLERMFRREEFSGVCSSWLEFLFILGMSLPCPGLFALDRSLRGMIV